MTEMIPIGFGMPIIFDFDGTIADSFNVFVQSLEDVLHREPLTNAEILRLRGLSTKEVINSLGVKKRQLPRLVVRGRREVANRIGEVEIFDGVDKALKELAKNHSLYILSTNDKDAIMSFLRRYRIDGCFDDVRADVGIFDKKRRLSALIRQNKMSAKRCVYVGDETRDVEAANALGIYCVAVAWGYSTPEALHEAGPSMLVEGPKDLVSSIVRLSLKP